MTMQPQSTRRYEQRTATGRYDFTSVVTRWEPEVDGYVTRVDERRDAAWCPLEYHRSDDAEQARSTHRAAVRRHPKKGIARTQPRTIGPDGRCTRCGEHYADAHHPRCRD